MSVSITEIMQTIAQRSDTPTDEFDSTETNTRYTLIDFNADMWTPADLSIDARACGFNFSQHDADVFLDAYVGVIVSVNLETNTTHTWLFKDSDAMEQEWSVIESDAQRHAARSSYALAWSE